MKNNELAMNHNDMKAAEFIDAIREIIYDIDFVALDRACNSEESDYARGILGRMHHAFLKAYGTEDLSGNKHEFVNLPAVILTATGKVHLGLVCLDLTSSGEHWGTDFFTESGVIVQDPADPSYQPDFFKKAIPYSYWYTPKVEGDIHVDFNRVPAPVSELLATCRDTENTFLQKMM